MLEKERKKKQIRDPATGPFQSDATVEKRWKLEISADVLHCVPPDRVLRAPRAGSHLVLTPCFDRSPSDPEIPVWLPFGVICAQPLAWLAAGCSSGQAWCPSLASGHGERAAHFQGHYLSSRFPKPGEKQLW